MWQRIQTVLLAIGVIAMFLMIFFPIWIGTSTEGEVVFYAFYLKTVEADIYLPYTIVAILAIASITVGIIEISSFKNRILQIKLGAFNSLLMAGTMVSAILLVRGLEDSALGSFGIALFLPAIGMILNSVANRFIRRDERLVRESDRLR